MRTISFAAPTPSFTIAGAASSAAPVLRLDQIDSQQVLRAARHVLFHYQQQCPMGRDPVGVVLQGGAAAGGQPGQQGRVVFDTPILLPDEQFIAMEWIFGRSKRGQGSRLRMPKQPTPRPWGELQA